jgi:hypothetical protein
MFDQTFFKFAVGFLCIIAVSFFLSSAVRDRQAGEGNKAAVIQTR